MKQIMVLATKNRGKVREIQELLAKFPVRIKNLDDFGPIPEVIEDGKTFDDNAYKKASFTARVLGYPAMADDSGLCVKALGGEPGIYSARYAGENADDKKNLEKVLYALKNEKDRRASFECVISIAVPSGSALTYKGSCKGLIASGPAGNNGFGYDPVFFCPEFNKTFAQLTVEEKGRVSHRGRALQGVLREFDGIMKWLDMNMPLFKRFECRRKE